MSGDVEDVTGRPEFPRGRTLVAIGAEADQLSVSVLMRRRGSVRTSDEPVPQARIPAVTTFDMSAGWAFTEKAALVLAVRNIADRPPPIAAFVGGNGVLAEYYDLVGRRFSVAVSAQF